jgi:hypothetical protein
MRRPSAPLVISMVALFAALGGTSYAAAKITGKEIAKKTIKGGNVATKTLSGKKMKLNTLGGDQINESKLGPVPNADHATAADSAGNADKLDGLDSAAFMTVKPRAYEARRGSMTDFGNDAALLTLADLPGGTYVVTAKLTYDNDGVSESEECTLHVPGTDDTTDFVVGSTETVYLQQVVTSASSFSPYVSCTSDANDDLFGYMNIIANRVD